ncbi:MAG: O-antigen ligase family protein [Candidatus Yanofskybacteria bacterium]|nr:O-antigen ligase family protein [Candidatus Yanofskybacteria bacterium]
MFNTLKKPVNIVFLIEVVVVFLVAFGVIPRNTILGLAILTGFFVLWADLETATAFFVRSVPIFVAIPLTPYFDSFNIWRIASGLIFLKWFFAEKKLVQIKKLSGEVAFNINFQEYQLSFFALVVLVFSLFSLIAADDLVSGIKRIIYFTNLSLIGFVIYDLVRKKPETTRNLVKNILLSGVIVAVVAVAQLISAYMVSIYEFMDFWAGSVQLGFYGSAWSQTAQEANTWFAYFGPQLSLRIFSTLPDSHSFPIFLLLAIPSLLAFSLTKVFQTGQISQLKKLIKTRASLLVILIPIFFLLVILSGTRGIWLAVLGPIVTLPFLLKLSKSISDKNILKYISLFFVLFPMLFSVAYPIFGSDQFQIKKTGSEILAKRIRSILDLEETSNNGRIAIWKASVASIIKKPLLGVGIGNYPVVLSQETEYAKAGSSAHNLYLTIAAEIGILGLVAVLGTLLLILKSGLAVFWSNTNIFNKVYSASFVLYTIWVLFYSLTDAALFDERAFLIFAVNSAIILSLKKPSKFEGAY